MRRRHRPVAGLTLLTLLLASACADAAGEGETSDGETGAVDAEVSSAGITLSDAWIRPTPPVTNVAAFYLVVANDGPDPDRVVGASAPRCDEIEIHQTRTTDGVASMGLATADELEVEPGGELVLAPTGLHVMCLGLDEAVVAGERLVLTVELDRAGPLTVEALAENR